MAFKPKAIQMKASMGCFTAASKNNKALGDFPRALLLVIINIVSLRLLHPLHRIYRSWWQSVYLYSLF